jgi:Ca-activated chloride channel family protein
MIDELPFLLASMQHFHFLRPYWLLAFIVIYYIIRAFSLRDDSLAQWRNLMSDEVLSHLTVGGNNNNWLSPQKMSLIIAVPLCIVLMGPTWQQQPSPFSENNAPLIIALDVSKTMEQGDVQPSRLLRAKQKVIELLELRGDSKTALIAFSGSAHIVMPITNDREMIRHFLDALSENIMPVSGKLPETILPLADSLLATSTVPGTLLLIGDGATSNTVNAFKDFFATKSAQLIIWGFGKSAHYDDSVGDSASDTIPMQLEQLKALSDESNGRLVLMSNDNNDVTRVDNYIKHNLVIVDDNARPWHDSGYPFVFIVAFIFLFWFRKGWTLQW